MGRTLYSSLDGTAETGAETSGDPAGSAAGKVLVSKSRGVGSGVAMLMGPGIGRMGGQRVGST